MRRSRAYLVVREIVRTVFAFVVIAAFYALMIYMESIQF
jgi:hypothetical protein